MACFKVISWKIVSKEHFKLNSNEKEGTTNDISFSLDLINVKDRQNFYVGVSKPWLSVLGCLEQYNLNETSNYVVFIFFRILRFEIGGAAYLWMRLIHGRLRYYETNSEYSTFCPGLTTAIAEEQWESHFLCLFWVWSYKKLPMILVQIFQASTVVAQKLVKILYEKWSLIELLLDNFLANRLSILTKFASKWNAVGRWPLLYWSAGLQSTTKNLTPSFWKSHEVKQKECVKSEGWTNNQTYLSKLFQCKWTCMKIATYQVTRWMNERVSGWMNKWMNK